MNRFFLVSSGILFSILSGLLFTSSSVSAASVYDDSYIPTDKLYLGEHQFVDITDRFQDILNDEDNLDGFPVGTTVDYQQGNTYPAPEHYITSNLEEINRALNRDSEEYVITVNQLRYVSSNDFRVIMAYNGTSNEPLTAVFGGYDSNSFPLGYVAVQGTPNNNYGCNSVEMYFIEQINRIRIHFSSGCATITRTYMSGDRMTSTGVTQTYRNLFFTGEVEYPPAYEGIPVRESPPDDSSGDLPHGQGLSPAFMYQVDDKTLVLTDQTNPSLIDEYEIDLCIFQVPNNIYGDNFQEYQYDCESPVPAIHVFDEYGSYNILQRYYSSTNDLWYETAQVLKIDGTTYSGTAGGQADANSILNSLMSITVPTYGLQQALVAPIEFIGTFPSLAGVCQPIQLPLPAYIGSTDDIELPCLTPMYQSYAPAFLILWQVALTALVSYAIVNKVFAKLRETYNPRSDRIEATNL